MSAREHLSKAQFPEETHEESPGVIQSALQVLADAEYKPSSHPQVHLSVGSTLRSALR